MNFGLYNLSKQGVFFNLFALILGNSPMADFKKIETSMVKSDYEPVLYRVRDRFVIYCQNNDLLHPKTMIHNVKDRNSVDSHCKSFNSLILKFSYLKHFQEVSKLDQQAVKI